MDSPIIHSVYDPSGQYLCYVTVALDKQRVGVQPTQRATSSGIDTVWNENFLYLDDSKLKVTCLKWVTLASSDTVAIILGMNNGEIWLYSVLANEVTYKFTTGNSYEIKDLDLMNNQLWCIDSNDMFYQFDLLRFKLLQHFKINECVQLNKLAIVPAGDSVRQLLVASHSIFLVNIEEKKVVMTFPGHVSPVSTIQNINDDYFISGAENDRFLNVYDIHSGMAKCVLVAESDIKELSHSGQADSISVTTEDGSLEIFVDPLISNSTKKRGNKSKKSTKKIQIVSKDGKKVPIYNAFINKDLLNVSWLQNATMPFFKNLQWKELPNEYTVEISLSSNVKSKSADRDLHGKDLAAATNYVEGNARVTSGDNFKHVNDAIKSWERELTSLEQDQVKSPQANELLTESFGDKLESGTLARLNGKKNNLKNSNLKTATTSGTVTVILSQALQSNDHSLLETVLNNRDERVIRDTTFRLKPALAVILLERLAERIARQTHRQGPLNVWVKWCLIIHGGYLVSIPNLMSTLSSLHSTLKRRSDLLPRLLALNVRLDCTINKFKSLNYEASDVYSSETVVEEDEDDVEYNEELDDAGLIEDGEESYGSEDDESDDGDEGEEKYTGSKQDGRVEEEQDHPEEEEAGYSDVEME
ncbi:utp5p [Saccharomyces arboricola H-6]|uniref:Utp5p n=1 Tax=Saccharomyces arboricola (strain H-6 / AS 2.3317 / CBS 10644) TaxID=1160507 RepID=J8Q3N9_SACAR|nr:utp5p [Saccharomyces arboricola H-6]